MATINRIELQGKCNKDASPIIFAGRIVGYKFDISVHREFADEEGRLYYFIPCQVMLLPCTPTANFTYRGCSTVHLIGTLAVRSGSALVEVTEIEYIEED